MRKLSDRAKILLLVVDHRTERDDNGNLTRFFVPPHDGYDHHPNLQDRVWIYGSGDAAAFRGLEKARLNQAAEDVTTEQVRLRNNRRRPP